MDDADQTGHNPTLLGYRATGGEDKEYEPAALAFQALDLRYPRTEHVSFPEFDSGNNHEILPDCIGPLRRLKELYVSGNLLTSLPESLWQLTDLDHLDLSGNKLTRLSDNVGKGP